MAMIAIGTGTTRIGSTKIDANGAVISSTPASWTPGDEGGSVAVIPLEPETMQPAGPAEVFGDWDAANYLAKVLEHLRPTRSTNIPDLKNMVQNALKDGVDLCVYCEDYNCRDCVITEWKQE